MFVFLEGKGLSRGLAKPSVFISLLKANEKRKIIIANTGLVAACKAINNSKCDFDTQTY